MSWKKNITNRIREEKSVLMSLIELWRQSKKKNSIRKNGDLCVKIPKFKSQGEKEKSSEERCQWKMKEKSMKNIQKNSREE